MKILLLLALTFTISTLAISERVEAYDSFPKTIAEMLEVEVDEDLQECYDDCKEEHAAGSKELKTCIFGCIYPDEDEK